MATTFARQIQRSGPTSEWASVNPILAAGEFGIDNTLNRAKLGDGVTPWSSLGWTTLSTGEVASVLSAAQTIGDGVDATDGALAAALTTPGSASGTVLTNTIAAVAAGPTVSDTIRNTLLDGVTLQRVTQSEYDALTPDPTTLYIIT